MIDTAHHLAALVGARLCHDLISPIGAIGNGVELVALEARPRPEDLALLAESVAAANAKLRFFRVAFGTATPDQSASRMEVVPLLGDLYRKGRITIDWHSPADLSRPDVQTAFLALLCVEHSIPTGGNIAIRRDDTGWKFTAASPRLRHDADLWAFLSDPLSNHPVTPAQVQFPLTGLALARSGRKHSLDVGLTSLTLSF